MRILVAHADQLLRESLRLRLWQQGHDVSLAADGLEALAVLKDLPTDVLVLGERLLWGGAEGVLSQLEHDERLRSVRVVLLDANAPGHRPLVSQRIASRLPWPAPWEALLGVLKSVGNSALAAS